MRCAFTLAPPHALSGSFKKLSQRHIPYDPESRRYRWLHFYLGTHRWPSSWASSASFHLAHFILAFCYVLYVFDDPSIKTSTGAWPRADGAGSSFAVAALPKMKSALLHGFYTAC